MEIRAIDMDEVLPGIDMPPRDPQIEEQQEFIKLLSSRLASLTWVAHKKPELFAPTLFSFGIRRRSFIAESAALLPVEGWGAAFLIPAADRLRTRFGADWGPFPRTDTWPKILYEAIDDVVAALWCLRAGMPISAALIARTLLERWTLNVAHHFGIDREREEQDETYISRVWSHYPHPDIPHDTGSWWAWLSELLHGRTGTLALGDDAAGPLSVDPMKNIPTHVGISFVLELVLRQVRGGLTTIAEAQGMTDTITALQCRPPRVRQVAEPFNLTMAFIPLDYYETYRQRSEYWIRNAASYRTRVVDDSWELTRKFSTELTVDALLERRGRAVERARAAFNHEKAVLGGGFDPGRLASKMFRFTSIAQMGRLLAQGETGPQRDALATAAEAVEGAAHFWLEDSDYSLGCIRVLLEQTARLRVHRLKGARAARLEANGRTQSSRWIYYAGWGRLAVLMRAVNEFSHLGMRTRRRGAREVLNKLQIGADDPQTRRGSAIMSVTYMFAFELHARLASDATVASLFTDSVTLLDEEAHVHALEAYLNNAQAWRDEEFGGPDFVSAEEWEEQRPSGAGATESTLQDPDLSPSHRPDLPLRPSHDVER